MNNRRYWENHLSRQQQTVCDMLVDGMMTKEIAHAMNIGIRSAEDHRKIVLKKMGVRNATQLAKKVLSEQHDAEMREMERALSNQSRVLLCRILELEAANGAR